MHSLSLRAILLGAIGFSISAIGSVLGGVSNSIVDGLVVGILVTVLARQIGSAASHRRLRGAASAPQAAW